MRLYKNMKTKLFVALALLSLGLLAACTGDTNTNSGTPNPNTLVPTGTIQGRLIDACTQQPIGNAIIDIGVATTATDARGQYIFRGVPATTQADGSVCGTYSATIDMRNATNASGQLVRDLYPAFAYNEMNVVFTTLDDANKDTASNHVTPVTGLTSGDQDIVVGKLAAAIKGTALQYPDKTGVSAPAAGFFVKLIATRHHNNDDQSDKDNGGTGSTNSTTGLDENVVATTVTAANGTFSFSNVEAQRTFRVVITDTDTTKVTSSAPVLCASTYVCAGCDTTVTFVDTYYTTVNKAPAAAQPCLVSVDPATNSNVHVEADGSSTITVTYTFNKAITGNSNNGALPVLPVTNIPINTLALTSPGNPDSLFALVDVNFCGYKDSNVAHSLSWNDARTQLIVTIPNAAPAAIYSVDISRALDCSSCASSSDANINFMHQHRNNTIGATDCCATDPFVKIYTFGASKPATPVLSLVNTPYDYDSDIVLSWLPVAQAKAYNVYCRSVQNWVGVPAEVGAYKLIDTTILASDTLNYYDTKLRSKLDIQDLTDTFIENFKIKLTWQCQVKGVNADGVEGDASNTVTAGDTVLPEVTTCNNPDTQLVVCFDEPMDKGAAQTITNYSFANISGHFVPPTISAATYDVGSRCTTLTLSKALVINTTNFLKNPFMTVAGSDVALNAINATAKNANGNACKNGVLP